MIRRMGLRKDFFGVSDMGRILGAEGARVKKNIEWIYSILALFMLLAACQPSQPLHSADLSDIPPPPPIRFDATPVPTLLPRTNLYLFLSSDRPVYYRKGSYYQNWKGNWFASDDLRGPWRAIEKEELPDLLVNVPPDYFYENFPYKLRKDR